MNPGNLLEGIEVRSVLDILGTAATTDRNGATIDMLGYDGVLFLFKFGAIGTVAPVIKAQQGQQSDLSDAADLAGTLQSPAATDGNKIFSIDIFRPLERYVRVVVDKTTGGGNESDEAVLAILYKNRKQPIVQGSDVAGSEIFSSPPEGTA